MIRVERIMEDKAGKKFVVRVEIDEGGAHFENAIARLANRARSNTSGTATAADGMIRVQVEPERP